ncbi:MAG: recombinase family protein [Pirellulaceae bacterium]
MPTSDQRAVEAVRIMFESAGDGASYGSIARDLNRSGFTTMFGKPFNATAVRRTVSNPTYAGRITAGRERRGKFRSVQDDGVAVRDAAHEPLVSHAAFGRAQRAIRRKYRAPKAPTPGRYLLTGILYLADGGHRLQGYTTGHTGRKFVRRYYGLPFGRPSSGSHCDGSGVVTGNSGLRCGTAQSSCATTWVSPVRNLSVS